LNSSSAIL